MTSAEVIPTHGALEFGSSYRGFVLSKTSQFVRKQPKCSLYRGIVNNCFLWSPVSAIHVRDLIFLLADTFLPLARRYSSAQLFFSGATFFFSRRDSFIPARTFLSGAHLKTATIFIAGSKYVHGWSKMADVVDNDLEEFSAESSRIRK